MKKLLNTTSSTLVLFFLPLILLAGPEISTCPAGPPETEIWYVTLEMDIQTLLENKNTNLVFPARFSFRGENGELVEWDIKVGIRGRFRRMKCDFPPLMLKFPKKESKTVGFGKHNDVKLVTHCLEDKKAEETLFKEFLTYQLYETLTDISFRTRLLHITYRDTNTGSEMVTYGIFIEDSDALAERLEAKECNNCFGLTTADFAPPNLQVHDLFQYMISNTDWAITTTRNLKVFEPKDGVSKKMIAPYDFDFSGLVNAGYAIPNVDYNQAKIRDRIYLGANWTPAEWEKTLKLFHSKRQDFDTIIDDFEFLQKKEKRDLKKFLDSFYEEIEDGFTPQKAIGNKG